jgi:hypothetical protein
MRIKLITFLVLTAGWIFAQKTDYNTAVKALQQIKAEDYPESSTMLIGNDEVVIDKYCLGTHISESYSKILNEQGKQSSSQVYFGYDSNYDTVEVSLIEIIKSNGTVVKIDPAQILKKVSQNAFSGFSNIYSETQWILTGSLPDVNIGDIVHQVSNDITHKARMENNFFDRISINSYNSVYKNYYELTAPKSLKINVIYINKKDNLVKFNIEEKGDNKIYTCSFDYIPQVIYEPNMDDLDRYGYYIMFTTVDKWEDISKWYYSLVKNHLEVDQAMKDTVASLTKNCKDNEEKIKKIFYWAAQKIRYLGVDKEKNRPGFEPHDVTYTFSTCGGVCRDKAAMIVAMLRIANIPSDPILISVGSQLNSKAPVMWFNHAIAITYDKEGNPLHILDPTSETSKDYFPQYEEDCTYIIAREKGADLQLSPISKPERNNTKINIDLTVDKDNNTSGVMTISFSGLADTWMRSQLMESSPIQRKESLQRRISKINPAAVLSDYTISDPDDKDKDIVMVAKFNIPYYIENDGKYLYIPFESSKLKLSFIYDWEMETFSLSERNYPFKLNNTFSVDIEENLKLFTPIKNASIPKNLKLDYLGFSLAGEDKLSADRKEVNSKISLKVNNIHFKQEDYILLKQKLSQLEKLEKLYIIGNI